jgi:uncharacterized phage-associated protein
MASVYDIANCFVYFSLECGDEPVTNLRLNKLLWFAQGHALATLGRSLFVADFEAWELGPVVPAIYHKYKYCGNNAIAVVDEDFEPSSFADEDAINLLLEVANQYNKFPTSELVGMSHEKDSPWFVTGLNEIISQEKIIDWFAEPERHLTTLSEIWANIDSPPLKILPAEWYDPEEDKVWEELLLELEAK